MNVKPGQESNFARRFLKSKLQAGRDKAPQTRPYGSKYGNRHPWKNITNSLNQYNLSNAQKNMIRRINIAIASQPFKLPYANRAPVKFNIKNLTRNEAIQKQKNKLTEKVTTYNNPLANENVFYNAQQQFEPENNLARQMLRQHRQAYGN